MAPSDLRTAPGPEASPTSNSRQSSTIE
jgi:hypothetical protein